MNRLGSTLTFLVLLLATVLAYPQPVAATIAEPSAAAAAPDPGVRELSGTLMIGDSITWRSEPTLRDRHPGWHVDAKRGRPVKALGPRLRAYLRGHPMPETFVMALGSNRSSRPPWTIRRYAHALLMLPQETNVLLLLVTRPGRFQAWKDRELRKYNRWSRRIARVRPNTYVIPWRSVVRRDPTLNRRTGRSQLLEDGVHPTGSAGGPRTDVAGPGVETYVRLVERVWRRANR